MIKAPCKDCKNREIGCHEKCEAYKNFKENNDAVRKKLSEEKYNVYTIDKNKHLRMIRRKRNAGNHGKG